MRGEFLLEETADGSLSRSFDLSTGLVYCIEYHSGLTLRATKPSSSAESSVPENDMKMVLINTKTD